MDGSLEHTINKYRAKGLLLDTNVLLLHVVGITDPSRINSFKRTQNHGYSAEDFLRLEELRKQFRRTVTTPGILTEVSNLLGRPEDAFRRECFKRFSAEIVSFDEQYEPSREIASDDLFSHVGLTDCAIKRAAMGRFLVLTDDYRLANRLQHIEIDTINFNHLRQWF